MRKQEKFREKYGKTRGMLENRDILGSISYRPGKDLRGAILHFVYATSGILALMKTFISSRGAPFHYFTMKGWYSLNLFLFLQNVYKWR